MHKFDSRLLYVPLGVALALSSPDPGWAGGHQATGTRAGNQIFITAGPANATGVGDFISSTAGLNQPHNVFLEVPPGVTSLTVEIFDGDILGVSAANEATVSLDGNFSAGTATQSTQYTILDPAGAIGGRQVTIADGTNAALHNVWASSFIPNNPIANPTPGHWEVRVDTQGNDLGNAYGVRASSQPGGPEINVYTVVAQPGFSLNGTTATVNRTMTMYPYITSGCQCTTHDFDFDNGSSSRGGNFTLTSRLAGFASSNPGVLSGNDAWNNLTHSSWVNDLVAREYGIWGLSLSIFGTNADNWSNFYMLRDANVAGAEDNPNPASNAPTGSFRIYLPSSSNTAPLEPFVEQVADVPVPNVGPNPPLNGQTSRIRVTVTVVNPTPNAITFNATNNVQSTVPTTRCDYAGLQLITQGSIVSQPTPPASGNIVWNPGVVAGNSTAQMRYFVDVTPSGNNQRTLVTGSVATNGTRAIFVDGTGNTTQARATYTFGPLCELAITSTSGPALLVDLDSFDVVWDHQASSPIALEWTTAAEVNNAGFNLYRAALGANDVWEKGEQLNGSLIPAKGDAASGASYSFIDPLPAASPFESRAYFLEDVDFHGETSLHGPAVLGDVRAIAPAGILDWAAFAE